MRGIYVMAALAALLSAVPARALDYYSTADVSDGYVSLTSVTELDYYSDCMYESLCEAYVEGQEYVNDNFVTYEDSDNSTGSGSYITAEVDIYDTGVAGNTYTMEGFYYAYNSYLEEWDNLGYSSDSVDLPPPPPPPPTEYPPVISGISPSVGSAGTAGYIAIYGYYLSGSGDGNVSVNLGGTWLDVVYVSDGQVNAYYSGDIAPLLAVGNYQLSLSTSWGSSNGVTFTVNGGDPTPSISSVSPTSWYYNQNNSISISGSGFGTAPDVQISYPDGATEWASVTNQADTLIDATTTHQSQQSGSIAVTVYSNGYWGEGFIPSYSGQPNYGTLNNAATVTVPDPTPTITSVSPASWQAGNIYAVAIYGTGFGDAPTVTVSFPDGTNQTYSGGSVSATDNHTTATASLTVAVPGGEPTGTATVTVTSDGYMGNGFQGGGSGGGGASASRGVGVAGSYSPTITSSGATVNSGAKVYVTAAPAMPSISAAMQGAGSYSTQWSLSVSYARPDGTGTNTDSFGPGTISGSNAWTVPWNSSFRGGTATISWVVNNSYSGSMTFNILGTNPANSAIDALINGSSPPWFFSRIVSAESSYLQFSSGGSTCVTAAGYPCYTNDHGFGLTQVTTSAGQDLWNWQTNISDGLAVLNLKRSAAYAFEQQQILQWQTYNTNHPSDPFAGPEDTSFGASCLFTYPVRTGSYDFSDANWIKAYNGASVYFLSFNVVDGSPFWAFNDSAGYIQSVCAAQVL